MAENVDAGFESRTDRPDRAVSKLARDGRLAVMFLLADIKLKRAGVENAALLRAKAFERELGIVPHFLSVNYDAHFSETRTELVRSAFVSENVVFHNMYDFFQELGTALEQEPANEFPVNERWSYKAVRDTPDTRVSDETGRLVMYKKCSRATGVLEYVNFFHLGTKWRRDTYTPQGVLSRIQYLNSKSGSPEYEHYLRPDGSVALIQLYDEEDGEGRLSRITWMDRNGFCVEQFTSQLDVVKYWLTRMTADPERRYIMVSDRNRFYYQPLRQLKSLPGKENVFVVPVIHSVHTSNSSDVLHARTKSTYAGILGDIQAPDAIVVGTEKQKGHIIQRYGGGEIHAIPHAFNDADAAPLSDFQQRDRMKLVYLGRYSPEKNQAAAIRAFQRVLSAVPEANLHLYGSGRDRAALEELAGDLGLEQSVHIHEFVADVSAVYRTAGLTLLTSVEEGYPLVIMESLCQGCPVIAFDVNYGPSDMLQEGETGFLVPFGDEALLAQRIVDVLNDPGRHEQMCASAKQSSRQFGVDVVADSWERLIGDLVDT